MDLSAIARRSRQRTNSCLRQIIWRKIRPPNASGDSAELAKKLSNPVASLISVPFQFNYDEGFGPKDAYKDMLNVQPVIPISINQDWNLIIRTIVPVVYQDS